MRRAFDAAHLMRVPPVVPTLEPREQLVGRAPVIQEVCKQIGRVAPQDVNVLILGESGTGKELIARARLSPQPKRAEQAVPGDRCAAACPKQLIEERAQPATRRGRSPGRTGSGSGSSSSAEDGTIFLDEIGDMPMAAQAKVLRLLQDQTFERVGGRETIKTHVRVIAATNQDLGRRIAAGQFRADLFYRLQGVTLTLPALRDRADDIAELAHHFLFLFNRELGLNVQGFDPDALACLRAYRWPGNVRELQAVLKESMLRATGGLLLPEFLPPAVRGRADAGPRADPSESGDDRPAARSAICWRAARTTFTPR